jgi:hypothetical protein
MKKILLSVLVVVVIAGAGLFLFREPVFEMIADRLTADMFVAADEDNFDPGLAVGERFPAVLATHQGRTVTDAGEFLGPNGLVFYAVRSADW